MSKFKEQWDNYFDGKIEMWSYFGYSYHSYLIAKHILPLLDIPNEGDIIQMGTALGLTVEKLCDLYGYDRVVGYDLFNPLDHPNIQFLDSDTTIPPNNSIAYIEIDVGSISHAEGNRKLLLEWAASNMVSGGYILTNKKLKDTILEKNNNIEVIDLTSFDVGAIWKNPHNARINTKILLKVGNNK